MKYMLKLFVTILITCFASSAFAGGVKPQVISNVVRVFMHQPGDYSIMQENSDGYKIARITEFINSSSPRHISSVTIKKVSEVEQMRVEITLLEESKWTGDRYHAVIYITGPDVIGGAEWRSGKNGNIHHQTEVVR
jgi:hypothetical protein